MQCSKCQFENPDGTKFCGECGAKPVPDGSPCDDSLFCTTMDSCASGKCIGSGTPCGASCQTCNEVSDECEVDAGYCLIGNICVAAGQKESAGGCEECSPALSQSAWSASQAGDPCDNNDSCGAG